MDGDVRINPYLAGNFAPVRSEDDFDLNVTGEIPAGLRGALFRIGPNPQFEPLDPNHHWFGGDGMVHGFYVADGKVSYRNRYVQTPKWKLENEHGRVLFGTMGNPMTTDPVAQGNEGGAARDDGRKSSDRRDRGSGERGDRDTGASRRALGEGGRRVGGGRRNGERH